MAILNVLSFIKGIVIIFWFPLTLALRSEIESQRDITLVQLIFEKIFQRLVLLQYPMGRGNNERRIFLCDFKLIRTKQISYQSISYALKVDSIFTRLNCHNSFLDLFIHMQGYECLDFGCVLMFIRHDWQTAS